MRDVLSLGQMLSVHARLYPDRPGASDLDRAMTFRQWSDARKGLGIVPDGRPLTAWDDLERERRGLS